MAALLQSLTDKQRTVLLRILAAAGGLALVALLCHAAQLPALLAALLYLIPYLTVGWDVLYRAARNIRNRQVFDENFLMSLATVGAFVTGSFAEAVFVMLLYQIGELFQTWAVNHSRRSIAALMDIRPDTARVENPDGSLREEDPEDVSPGTILVIRPGERVPLDGVVISGSSSLDTAALTGESLPRDVGPGQEVISGCVNGEGLLRVRVTRSGADSTVSRILELVENAGEKKAVTEQYITRFARYYTPCVVIAAIGLAVLPPLFTGHWGAWFHRALIFLVVSCPCALVISVPLGFFGGMGGASKQGILVKGGTFLEALAKTEIMVFDKTGTLTEGRFSVTAVHPGTGFSSEQTLVAAALAETHSTHPIALSIRGKYQEMMDGGPDGGFQPPAVTDAQEAAGLGLRARVGDVWVCVGSRRLMERMGLESAVPPPPSDGTVSVYVSVDGTYAGEIRLSDLLKSDAKEAVADLKADGIQKTVLLTGDGEASAQAAASALGMDEYHAALLPQDKVALVERLLEETRPGTTLAFVGDGINDAPVLARSDVGIAMGALGSDAAIEAADIVLMDDKPSKIAAARRIARRTMRIVRENIVFSLAVKGGVLLLTVLGYAAMWAAVFADVGVAFLAILNSMRALRSDAK